MFYAGQVWADSWQNSFLFRVSTEYDTNPAMSPTYPGGVWRALLEPGYTLTGRVGENDLKAGLGVQFVRSTNKALDPDRDNPTAFLEWLRQNDTGEFGISTRYAEVATRDSGIDATGRGPADSTRASRVLSGTWSNRFSARSTLSANGSYEGVSYRGGNYVDYSMRSGGLRFSYAVDEITTSFFRISGIRYVPADGGPYSNLADATLGLNWNTANTDWTMQAGKAKVSGAKPIWEGSVATRFTGERTDLALIAGRTVLPSGLGGFVQADQARGSWRYALNEYDNTGIDLERRKNLPINFNTNITRSTSSDIWVDHDFTSLWKMRIYYRLWINQINGSESVTSNILGLSFSYNMSISTPEIEPNHD